MYNRLLSFLNKCKLINKNQFGFRNNHSTFMALLIMLENMRNALDNGECAVGIFLDFQKAFDTVDHDGMGGLPWNGSKVTFQIDIKLLNIMIMNWKLDKYRAESHRDLY